MNLNITSTGNCAVLYCRIVSGATTADIRGGATPFVCEGTVMTKGLYQTCLMKSGIHKVGGGANAADQYASLNDAMKGKSGRKHIVLLEGDIALTSSVSPNSGASVTVDGQGRYSVSGTNSTTTVFMCSQANTPIWLKDLAITKGAIYLGFADTTLKITNCVMRVLINVTSYGTETTTLFIEDSTLYAQVGYPFLDINDVDPSIRLTNSDVYYDGTVAPIKLTKAASHLEIEGCVITGNATDGSEVYPISNPPSPISIISHRNSYTIDPFTQVNLANSVGTPYDVIDPDVGTIRREP
jgi:hypothetical protein